MSKQDATLTTFGGRSSNRQPAGTAPHLFVVLHCDRPAEPSLRCCLAGVDEAVIGRASDGGARRERADDLVSLRIDVADPRMSSEHARLERAAGRWVLLDRSKNGSFINGTRTKRAALNDGDVIELGHTLLLFRAALPVGGDERAIVDAAAARATPGWTTLVPTLASELDRLAQVATSAVPVLIAGDSGTGKELIARGLHAQSGRRGPFVAVNCGALPDTLVESELFGYRKGAFSGADRDRSGVFRDADDGTLLLDEIGDLPLPAQAALLRVLQEREVVPLGGSTPVAVDVRVVGASHRDLEAMVAAGEFREDLLARLSGFVFELPPLRERRADLGIIIATLLARANNGSVPPLSVEAGRALLANPWPRNVRELEQCLTTASALARGAAIGAEHLPAGIADGADPAADLSPDDRQLRDSLIEALRANNGNVAAVARTMGKARQQIQRWLKRFDIDPARYRA